MLGGKGGKEGPGLKQKNYENQRNMSIRCDSGRERLLAMQGYLTHHQSTEAAGILGLISTIVMSIYIHV